MRKSGMRRLSGWLLLIMLMALVPSVASAQGEWQRIGQKVWLDPGQGINLATGGPGNDLVFKGDTIYAPLGIQILSDSDYVDYDLVAPRSGYATSLETSETVYNRVVVRLAGGGLAQVRIGMGSSSGLIYTGLFLEEWAVQEGSGTVEPILRGEAQLRLNSPEAVGNGVPKTLDVPPQMVNGQVMLPLRYLGETMGLTLRWDGREQKVSITGEGLSMTLWVGKSTALINDQTVNLPGAPTVIQNRLLIPLMVAGEALAGKATYDAASGAITLGGSNLASPQKSADPGQAAGWPRHFSAIWLNGYENGWISESEKALPDFYLTLNADGTARVIQTITGLIGAAGYPVNLEYLGTYTLNPLRVELKLQPAIEGWETLEHSMPNWQEMTVTGTLAADMSKIEDLRINDRAAKSGSATPAKRVPEPGDWR